MEQGKKTGKGKKAVIAAFLLLLFLPALLTVLSHLTRYPFDTALYGYEPPKDPVPVSISAWLGGEMQKGIASKVESGMRPRGVLVKAYNTANFLLFSKSERIIGKNYDIFEKEYINAELMLNPADDFSREENITSLKTFVSELEEVNRLLKQHRKTLVVYIAPSKGSLDRENIPDKYTAMANRDGVRCIDLFREEIRKTDVPCLICPDIAGELEYPAFYPTGIHWSRTYEQLCSQRVIDMIREQSGTPYGRLLLTGVKAYPGPIWRETDVLQLANVFYDPKMTCCEYETEWEDTEDYPPMLRMLLQGDSFALGLFKDLRDNTEDVQICLVTNDYSAEDWDGRVTLMRNDWEKFDWQYYLDNTDVVVVEIAEPFVKNRTYGFVSNLLARLKEYVPAEGR